MTTIYFAENCPYGVSTMSDADHLVRFYSAEARAAYLDAEDPDLQHLRPLGPSDRHRIFALGGAIASYVVGQQGELVPPTFAPATPASYKIGGAQ